MPTKEIAPGVLAVTELPYDAKCFVGGGDTPFCANPDGEYLNCRFGGSGLNIALPPGSWSIVGWSDELTEEQMKGIVEGNNGGENDTMFMDYPSKDKFMCYLHRTATQSFASLLRSHGIMDRALIIKKDK